MIDASAPFVLFDDARREGSRGAWLYRRPVEIVAARALDEVVPALERIDRAAARGLHAAGALAYEAGFALERRLERPLPAPPGAFPLLWFGLFEAVETFAPGEVEAVLPDAAGATAAPSVALVERARFEAGVEEALRLIGEGEIYQANLTFQNSIAMAGDPLALYAGLRLAEAGWGGVLFTGEHWLLSASPELFFKIEDGRISARPMKGTSPRGEGSEDRRLAEALAADPKQRAENLMIVDLIRNDISRIAATASVTVPSLFEVETYPTVHQLTSTVDAQLVPGRTAVDVLRAMYPCGSITGAPKIRAMEAIAAIEGGPRGPYTGSMGWIAPDGDAAFNVLIRTLSLADGASEARLGLGAGIVADSRPSDEWRECLLKGAFVTRRRATFDLVEAMRFDPREGLIDLERHLARIGASAAALGFAFDRHDARNELQAATFALQDAKKVRLRLARSGRLAIEVRPLPATPVGPLAIGLTALPVATTDFRLRHKTSDRAFYDAARAGSGCDEILFVDSEGFLTEGSFTSLFAAREGLLVTPPLQRGLLPGVLRQRLIDEGQAVAAELRPEDLTGTFWVGNSVRGLMAARLAASAQVHGEAARTAAIPGD